MSNDQANWYGNVFKSWNVKALGPKPTAEMLASIHGLQARPGKQALACAMALRDCGVTAGQIVIACGAPQLNKMRGFITDALLKRLPVAPSSEGHTVYKLELTAKGKQSVERFNKRAAEKAAAGEADAEKPAKVKAKAGGKAKGKGKKVKAADTAVAETPASEADNAVETVIEQPVTETVEQAQA